MLSVAKTESVWDTPNDFALQREMAEFGVGIVVVEVLSGPINDDDCTNLMIWYWISMWEFVNCEDECLRQCNVESREK